jgi:uncharacterized protein (TIGR02996 family)
MTDRQAFELAITSAPDDQAPRLIYADWLEEHGLDDEARIYRKFAARRFPFYCDRNRVKWAFVAIRPYGYFARMNFWCCNSCAWASVPLDKCDVVFFHRQDNEAFINGNIKKGYPLFLSWRGCPDLVLAALTAAGLRVTYESPKIRLMVEGATHAT